MVGLSGPRREGRKTHKEPVLNLQISRPISMACRQHGGTLESKIIKYSRWLDGSPCTNLSLLDFTIVDLLDEVARRRRRGRRGRGGGGWGPGGRGEAGLRVIDHGPSASVRGPHDDPRLPDRPLIRQQRIILGLPRLCPFCDITTRNLNSSYGLIMWEHWVSRFRFSPVLICCVSLTSLRVYDDIYSLLGLHCLYQRETRRPWK